MKPEIKFGVLAGISLILWTLVQYAMGFHTVHFRAGQISGYGAYVLIFVSLWMGLREKKEDYEGHFSLRHGMRAGVLQIMITAVIASFFEVIYDYKINKLWIEELVNWQKNNQSFGLTIYFTNDPNANSIILSNTESHLCMYFIGILIGGCSIAFLISAILSAGEKPKGEYEPEP
jgi:hypothetical protein